MDYRTPRHDERLKPCPVCGGEPWADSKNGTIYCDCGLRLHLNGECHPEWHRMDWTADEWNDLASAKDKNAKLEELLFVAHNMLKGHEAAARSSAMVVASEMQKLGIDVSE